MPGDPLYGAPIESTKKTYPIYGAPIDIPTTPTGSTGDGTRKSSSGDGGSSTGSGSSGSSSEPYEGPGKDYNDTDPNARFLGVGGHPEVWKDSTTGQMYLMYPATGTEPPVPLLYEVPDMETLEGFFGKGNKVVFDKTFSAEDLNATGAVRFGTTNNLIASEGDPWLGFLDRIERLKEVSPWANDDEILALIGGAYLENRDVKDWEIQTTDWWQSHNEAERQWLTISMSDPAQAEQIFEDNKLYVTSLFQNIGAEGNDPAMIDWMANQYTTGTWSKVKLASQVEAITSGWGEVAEEFQSWMADQGYEAVSTQQYFDEVRSIWDEWLGPAYPPTDKQIAEWATKIRNTADGKDELLEMLRNQRVALFPEYENSNLSWKDISGPWKALASATWGVPVDEADPFFQDVVRKNNADEASEMLRRKGFERGYDQVVNQVINGISSGTGKNVRGMV